MTDTVALWSRVKSVLVASRDNQKLLQDVYSNYNIPIEIRERFPSFIEEVFLPTVEDIPGELAPCQSSIVDNDHVQRLLEFMVASINEELNSTSQNTDEAIMSTMNLQGILDRLKTYAEQDPEIFKARMQACLNEELRMVAIAGASNEEPSFMNGNATELVGQIDEQQKNSISLHITELLTRIAMLRFNAKFVMLSARVVNEDANISIIQETQDHFFSTVENYKQREAEAKLFRSRYGDTTAAAVATSATDGIALLTGGNSSNPNSATSPMVGQDGQLSGPHSPSDPLGSVLAAEAQAHTDVILAAKTIQSNREAVYNSLSDTVGMMEVLKKHILVQVVEWCSKQQSYALPLTFSACGANATPSTASSNPSTPASSVQGAVGVPLLPRDSSTLSTSSASTSGATAVGTVDGFHTMPELLEQNLNRDLDKLQSWCESLCDSVLRTRHQCREFVLLKETVPLQASDDTSMQTLLSKVNLLLKDLVEKTFLVNKQPPQILKKDSKFSVSARHLVGHKLLSYINSESHGNAISVSNVNIDLYYDYVAKNIVNGEASPKTSATAAVLTNNQVKNETNLLGKQSCTVFKNLVLTKLKRTEKRNAHYTESVMEEKLRFILHTEITMTSRSDMLVQGLSTVLGSSQLLKENDSITFRLTSMSLPVVAIVHGSQEPKASAVILWDNKFANQFVDPFKVPDSVHWYELADLLNSRFVFGGEVNRLGAEDLSFLCSKLFHNQPIPENPTDKHNKNLVITWAQFYRGLSPGKNFTFWEWFYEITELMHDSNLKNPLYIRELWNKNYIRGFISKEQAKDLLMATQQPGTFLIRFAESEKAAITISWLCYLPGSVTMEVFNLKPFTVRDLQTRSLPDRIRDLHDLAYLYPNWPKDHVFASYYSSKEQLLAPNVDGYVKTDLITDIPMIGERLKKSGYGPDSQIDNAALDNILEMLANTDCPEGEEMGMEFTSPGT